MLKTLKSLILTLTLLLFPLFFLPFTQEFFTTNKLYLLLLADALLILISSFEMIFSKKLSFKLTKLDLLKIFFLAAVLLSTLIISPNKVQALLNPNFGFIMLLSIIIFISYLEKSQLNILKILSFSTVILSIITIAFYFQPFRNTPLPFELQFLKNRFYTPIGTQTDLAIFLGFMLLTQSIQVILLFKKFKKFSLTTNYYLLTTLLSLTPLVLTFSSLYSGGSETQMPFRYSWQSFAETLKNPFNAIFGIGIDNLPAAFTRVKDIGYNYSPLWQVRSFEVSRSAVLHIATESGLLGLSAIILILYRVILASRRRVQNLEMFQILPIIFIILMLIFSPPSLVVFFIFFLGLTTIMDNLSGGAILRDPASAQNFSGFFWFEHLWEKKSRQNLTNYSIAFLLIILTAALLFLLSHSYLAEFYFKQSVDALAKKNGKDLYENQRKSILANPFIERFHVNFSQTNLLLANALSADTLRVGQSTNALPEGGLMVTDIKIAQQIALIEANNAVNLNPQKASNWENLAVIARNLTSVFEDAQKKSIGAYEKAILLDPQNPQYRFSLGTLYYTAGDFTEAIRSFEHAVVLKTDWANAHYNLAWALYQNKDSEKAIKELEASISLLDKKKDKSDLAKAQKDLEMMKNKNIPVDSENGTTEDRSQITDYNSLSLPQPKPATPEPLLDIFEETSSGEILNIASPESEL